MDRIDTQPQCLLPNKLADASIKIKQGKVDNHFGIFVGRAPRKTILIINKTAVRGGRLFAYSPQQLSRWGAIAAIRHANLSTNKFDDKK